MKRNFWSLLLLLCCAMNSFGQGTNRFLPDEFSKRMNSDTLGPLPDTLALIQNDRWADLVSKYASSTDPGYTYKSIKNLVRVGINYDKASHIATPYKYRIGLKILCYNFSSPSSPAETRNITLDLSYNADSLQPYNDLSVYKFSGYHQLKVIITSVSDISTGTPVALSSWANNFYAEGLVIVQRYDKTLAGAEPTATPVSGNKELEINFKYYIAEYSSTCGTNIYVTGYKPAMIELEYMYVDDYQYNVNTGVSGYKYASGMLPFDFRKNATRVQVSGTSYRIPLVYEHGLILFRSRVVRPGPTNYKDPVYSGWSQVDYGNLDLSLSCLSRFAYRLSNPHTGDSLNWQYTVNFAEEGKYKHVINYFDGSLKGRQTQTKINTDGGYIVAQEKIYDYEGRPGISSLPTPVQQTTLDYRKDLLISDRTAKPYSAADFDSLAACSMPDSLAPLSSAAKANIYYSPLNPDKTGMQQFVPDAKGYPLVQTVFYPDNTDKVLWQGGAGKELQLWKGHGTRYDYVRADQDVLNTLLGTESGENTFYPRQIVTDPNGQSSFTVMNPAGKVVISALQGGYPDTTKIPIDSLKNFVRSRLVCSDQLATVVQDTLADGTSMFNTVYNDANGLNSLKYSVLTKPFPTGCSGKYLWAQGNYEVSVYSDCGVLEAGLSTTGVVGESKVTAADGSSYAATNPALSVSNMAKGKYMVSKKLAFSPYSIRRIVDSFVIANSPACYYDVNYFIRTAVEAETFPCQPSGGPTVDDPCDKMKKEMMAQLYPDAKYGPYAKDASGKFYDEADNSIFTIVGTPLPGGTLAYLPGSTDQCGVPCRTSTGTCATAAGPGCGCGTGAHIYPARCCSECLLRNCKCIRFPNTVKSGVTYVDSTYHTACTGAVGVTLGDWFWTGKNPIVPSTGLKMFGELAAGEKDRKDGTVFISGPGGIGGKTHDIWWLVHVRQYQCNCGELHQEFKHEKMLDDEYFKTIDGWPFYSTHYAPKILDRATTYKNLYGIHECTRTVKVPVTSVYYEPAITVKYRYQSDCIALPSSVVSNGISYFELKKMPPQQLIEIFNDQIAESLLPLHPEFCKLQSCSETFSATLENISTFREAEQKGYFSLDSILAKDPLASGTPARYRLSCFYTKAEAVSPAAPAATDKFDYMAISQAYCATGNPTEQNLCANVKYANEITNKIFINDQVKQRYFDALKALYISNRTLYKMKLDNNETGCSPCNAGERMRLFGDPVVSSIYDPYIYTGDGTKVSGGDRNFDGVPDWMRDLFGTALDGGTLPGIPTEFTTLASTMQADQRDIQVDEVMKRLANCTLNSTTKDNMRTALVAALSGGQELTPQLIKTIITGAGLSVNDLCHPFLAAVKILSTTKASEWSEFTCKDSAFYGGLRNFLNRTEVSTSLANNLVGPGYTSGISAGITLNTAGNSFEAAVATAVGSSAVKVEARLYKTSPAGGALDESYVKLEVTKATTPFTKVTLNFLAKKYGTDPKLNAVDGPGAPLVFRSGICMADEPEAAALGELTRYSAAVDAACSTCSTAYRYYVWADGVEMMNVAPNSRALQECVTCVDLKQALDSFKANQAGFGYSLAVNHPLAERTLNNYLNYKLGKRYRFDEYRKLMEGCAVTDKVALKEQIADYRLDFSSSAAATTFTDSMNRVGPYVPGYFRYQEGSTHTVLVDYRTLPEDSLLLYKTLMGSGSGPAAAATLRTYAYSTADEDNFVFVPDACTFSPMVITPALYYNNGGVAVSIWQNGAYSSGFKRYQFRLATSATPLDRAKMIADMGAYLQGGGGAACPGSYPFFSNGFFRSSDYNSDLKKAFLNLVYGTSSHSAAVAATDPSLLPAMAVPGTGGTPFSGYVFTYDNPFCKGSKDNLYAYKPNPSLPAAGYEGYKLLKDTILYRVRTEGGAKLFPNSASYFTTIAKDLYIIRKASGVYWYRFFGPGNKLYNAYLNIPEGKVSPDLYAYSNMRMGPHPRTFQVDVTYTPSGGSPITVTCNGYTDFTLGASLTATNVVLDKDPKGVSCMDTSDCERFLLENADANGRQTYAFYFDSVTRSMSSAMMTHLVKTSRDSLVYCLQQQHYQQTLYYYDLAGNLSRTVPPAGVVPVTSSLGFVNRFRDNPNLYFTEMSYPNPITQMKLTFHKKQSTYQYNALNQLVFQKTPDGGSTYFFYDAAGRQIFSQNSKQRPNGEYNYSLYDKQGRPAENGIIKLGCTFTPDPSIEFDTTKCQFYPRNGTSGALTARAHPDFVQYSYDEVAYPYDTLLKYVHSKSRSEVVYTIYDTMAQDLGAIAGENLSTQENLRSRVTAIRYYAADPPYWYTGSRVPLFSTHYSYDLAGNVQTISYDFYTLSGIGQRYKRVDYEYDQATGKVNMVAYNRGRLDQFYQQYNYDADNRITTAYTSNDGIIWNKDAAYTYYKHGPLAKLQIGDLKIQSLEYAYTIQGWLKAMNGDIMRPDKDMGANGGAGDLMYARDVVTHALSYFKDDYKPIGSLAVTNLPPPGKELFNGNIAQQTTGIGGLGNMARSYRYDQMQRLKLATNTNVDDASMTLAATPANLYRSSYEYDKDGNVTNLQRYNGGATPGLIDNFTYNYTGTAGAAVDNNKLLQVTDAVTTTGGGSDLQHGQPDINYDYDRIGNLVRDRQGAELIDWDRFGKVKSVRDTASRRYISFQYDGKGNRIYKEVTEPIGGVDTRRAEYYVRDAGGNILTVYNSNSKLDRRIIFTHLKALTDLGGIKPILTDYAGRTFPTGLKTAMLNSHATWVNIYTDRPVGFYLSIDPTLKSSLLYINDTWIDDLRDWDVSTGAGTHLGALVQAHHDAMPLFTSAMMYPTEGTKLFEWFSSQMPQMATTPVWSSAGQQYIPGNHLMNANNLFAAVNGNPGMQMTVAQNMADALINDLGMSGGVNTTAFYNSVVTDNTLWQSIPLRAQNGPWTAIIRNIINVHGDVGKLTGFYDQWSGSSAALAGCTTPEYRLNTVYDASPITVLDDMVDEASDAAIIDALTGSPDITTAEFGAALITKASVSATDVADAMLGSSGDTFRLAEHHIYGSARLGVQRYDTLILANTNVPDAGSNWALNKRVPWYSFAFGDLIDSTKKEPFGTSGNTYTGNFNVERRLGKRYFELVDHVGGVLATVLDRKTGKLPSGGGGSFERYNADIASSSDMYPGGMQMQNRTTEWMWSRFGAQGSMKDDEVYGKGNFVDMGDRHLDVRILRTPKPDAKATKYPHISPFNFANNNPIMFVDADGKDNVIYLIVLPSALPELAENGINAQTVATQANIFFKDHLKLNTRVVVFDGGSKNFDITKIDKNDAVAVLGSRGDVTNYVKDKLDEKFGEDLEARWTGPERSENSSTDGRPLYSDNIIALSSGKLKDGMYDFHMEDEEYGAAKFIATNLDHGAGHLSTRNHSFQKDKQGHPIQTNTRSILMMDGDQLKYVAYAPGTAETAMRAQSNVDYRSFMQSRFGIQPAQVNYPGSKAKIIEAHPKQKTQ